MFSLFFNAILLPVTYGGMMLVFNYQEDQELKREWEGHTHVNWKEKRERRHYKLWRWM